MAGLSLAEALAHGSGTERKFCCPVHGDENPSASVNVLKGVWICYRCHAHGKVDGSVFDDVDPVDLVAHLTAKLVEPEESFYAESWLDQFDASGPGSYWLSRFAADTARHFRLGYDAVADAATYPLRDTAQRVLGVVRRPLAEDRSRYRYPKGVSPGRLLFNYQPLGTKLLVLTEGATDSMAAWEVGYCACALFTNRISAAQMVLIDKMSPDAVVIAFDDDAAGAAGTEQALRLLANYPVRRAHYDGAKDLAELSPADRMISLEHAVAL